MHLGDRYGNLFQMSYITRDMDAAIAHVEREIGLGTLKVSESSVEVLSFGEPATLSVKAAIANHGSNQFEIIQPVAGPVEIYTDEVDLGAHILNFHHVAIAVPGPYTEWEKLLADVRESGDSLALLFPAQPDPDAKICFCYVDTRARIGHYTEYLWVDPALAGMVGAPAA